MINPRIGSEYRHKKGGLYRVIGFANHTETEEYLVVYGEIEGDYRLINLSSLWVMPTSMFCDGRFMEVKDVR